MRSRDIKRSPSLYVSHGSYCIEIAAASFETLNRVELDVVYGAGREDDADFEQECREWTARAEAAHPCFEVSWDGEVVIDGENAARRLYRGFKGLDEARAFLDNDPGDSFRLIDRRTGQGMLGRSSS